MAEPCVFCEIVAGRAPATMVLEWSDAIAFRPLNPVNEGHALVVPRVHVPHFAADPDVAAATMRRAAELMRWTPRPMNVITSRGREATQSVFHLHLHLVPRTESDGLALPWSPSPRVMDEQEFRESALDEALARYVLPGAQTAARARAERSAFVDGALFAARLMGADR